MNKHATAIRCLQACLGLVLLITASASADSVVWKTEGYADFIKGQMDSGGANLYVSRKGTLQTVHQVDVNGDHRFDLLFANTHDRAHVLPSYQYTFAKGEREKPARAEYPGVGAFRTIATDLDGDGLPELIIGRGDDNVSPNHSTSIYWGTPEGWSERFHTQLLTPTFRDLAVGDLNGDKRPDLAIVSGSNILIYWGQADGFAYDKRLTIADASLTGCFVADVDGDGASDLIVVGTKGASRVIWGGTPDLATAPSTLLPADTITAAGMVGAKLAIATASGLTLCAVEGRQFKPVETIDFPEAGRFICTDLNNDDSADLVISRTSMDGNFATNSRIYWGGKSPETYSKSAFTDLPTLGATDVTAADVDGDGFKDVIFANSRDNDTYSIDSYIYWGSKEGYEPAHRAGVATNGAQAVTATGPNVIFANNVIARRRGDIDSFIYLSNPSGVYDTAHLLRLPTIGAYVGCFADLNDDGLVDVLISNSYEDAPNVAGGSPIYWGSEKGISAANKTMVPSRMGLGCAVDDLDRDGYLDLVFTNLNQNSLSIFYGSEDNNYRKREQVLKVPEAVFPSIADLNKDDWLDLLVPAKDGLHLFWGSAKGFSQENQTLLPGIGAVAVQVADLNGDGYLDIILCNMADFENRIYSGIHSYIYWGSADGYSTRRRMDLPSMGATFANVADYNKDGHLDIFVSNYMSEHTRDLVSFLYWGDSSNTYSADRRTELRVGSASGAVSGDFNNDGWIDLAVANHYEKGTHFTNSYIFWNGPKGFDNARKTALPTQGAHLMTSVDRGNIYSRALRECYTSSEYDGGSAIVPLEISWEGKTPHETAFEFQMRGGADAGALRRAAWVSLGVQKEDSRHAAIAAQASQRWWQYRVHFIQDAAASPLLSKIEIKFTH